MPQRAIFLATVDETDAPPAFTWRANGSPEECSSLELGEQNADGFGARWLIHMGPPRTLFALHAEGVSGGGRRLGGVGDPGLHRGLAPSPGFCRGDCRGSRRTVDRASPGFRRQGFRTRPRDRARARQSIAARVLPIFAKTLAFAVVASTVPRLALATANPSNDAAPQGWTPIGKGKDAVPVRTAAGCSPTSYACGSCCQGGVGGTLYIQSDCMMGCATTGCAGRPCGRRG